MPRIVWHGEGGKGSPLGPGRELLFVAKSFVCLPKAAGGGRGNCCDCLPFLMAFICFDITSLQGVAKRAKGKEVELVIGIFEQPGTSAHSRQ